MLPAARGGLEVVLLPGRRDRPRRRRELAGGVGDALHRAGARPLRFLAKHHGQKTADRARRVLLAGLRLRSLLFQMGLYRNAADWLRSTR